MTKQEIFESGFVRAFIEEYFEEQKYNSNKKDRLLYALCENDKERNLITKTQIESIKSTIQKLGFEELSFSYLLTCNIKHHEYIEPNQRNKFWIDRFIDEFDEHINEFNPISVAMCLFNNTSELDKLEPEAFELEDEFWEMYPDSLKPEIQDSLAIVTAETKLLWQIEYDIEQYKKGEFWEIDFDDYQKYIDFSKPLELLFDLSELLVQLDRLIMFKHFGTIETSPLKSNVKQLSEQFEDERSQKLKKLKTIWLPQAKISIDDFAQKGIDKGLWNDKLEIITSKGRLYGTGKAMLGSLFIAFRGWAISSEIDYKEAGKVFCEIFGIEIKETTKEPYKAFSSGSPRLIKQFKRTFNIENS